MQLIKVAQIVVLLLLFSAEARAQWEQIGKNIVGESPYDHSGQSVSLNADGTIVAIGAHNNSNGRGHVRVYKNDSGNWMQLGQDIDGEAQKDFSGITVSLSSNGSIVAIGSMYNNDNGRLSGHVRVWEYNNGQWTQLGQNIPGENEYDESGKSISLSSDGKTLAIGAALNDGNGMGSGHVRVYTFSSNVWTQVGEDIDGETAPEYSGASTSLNSEGTILAIGAPLNKDNGERSGQVRVYKYFDGIWNKLGEDINGKAGSDLGSSVSLSSDGLTLAVGARFHDNTEAEVGRVQVYKFSSDAWNQIGEDIIGQTAYDHLGTSVNLNANGSILAIGASLNTVERNDPGYTQVYQNRNGTWKQIGENIYGEARDDGAGRSVSLSSNGLILATGAPDSPMYSHYEGYVQVFRNTSPATDLLTATNFTVTNTGATCRSSNNGKIEISAEAAYEYSAVLSANGTILTNKFTDVAAFNNLAAGSYELCITIADYPEFEQCFNIEVKQPEVLEVNSAVNVSARRVHLKLRGSDEYIVNVNGKIYKTTEDEIELDLNSDQNVLIVSTGLECQGNHRQQILLGSEVVVYPNPVSEGEITINFPATNPEGHLLLSLFSDSGRKVISRQLNSHNGAVTFNVEALIPGVYTLLIQSKDRSYYSRIIKNGK